MAYRKYNFIGEKPSDETVREIAAMSFERKPISKPEVDACVRKVTVNLLISLGGFAVTAAIIIFTLFAGYYYNYTILIFIGTVCVWLCFFVFAVWEIIKLIKDPRPKTPEAAVEAYLKNVLVGGDTNDVAEKSDDYAYNYLCRMTPIPVTRENFNSSLGVFRAESFAFIIKIHQSFFPGKYQGSRLKVKYKLLKKITGEPENENAIRLRMFYNAEFLNRGKDATVSFTDLIFSIEMSLVKCGKYWVIPDPLPEWEDVTPEYNKMTE